MEQTKKILVSGASFAGLTTAYWLSKLGCKVTVVEIGSHLKMGGTPVDIKGQTIDIVKRMGLFEQIKANRIGPEKWEFKNAGNVTEYSVLLEKLPDNEFEIERDLLLNMLFDLVKKDVEFVFNNSITALNETKDNIEVTFKDSSLQVYDLVIGCDGIHSVVRKIWFGHETEYAHFLGQYFSIAISNKLLVEEGTYQMFAEPNKGVALYAYNHKTDIIFTFRPEAEIPYDFRNQQQQKQMILTQFENVGWRTKELLGELINAKSFFFDKFCQIKMPSWTKGRVALVGDAGYCASPAAGMGGALAIIGAKSLADAFEQHNGNFELAFESYNKTLRPFIEEVQAGAVEMLDKLLPRTEEEVRLRNQHGIEI
ncbi:2-polyprenyl-6-methoxyphenol hydroxylase-like FAD-dependent oxidoreductase [Chitinophaga polysaccharea]|uniref:2-polyprenyl-6-methoxyphenol hydroxylase-like FAD-dependent oxidoreductase n=1 Tax=Chitinophaga polysaccharea TaxID=1293035 RepID=A0A561PR66_9BACT|nr:FAD-dependent monooxygenase [Chitinophaga polysaccharea]TWF40584.1 2-polyprenyl-6-methoxyphenol hydroxylase-like FAD-dependent oxidoreductase [Chitinophaga polysaccharea]